MPELSQSVWCVIPAAGAGRRMGGDIPKQYLRIGSFSVLERVINLLAGMNRFAGIAVGTSPDDAYWDDLPGALRGRVERFSGGLERTDTVLKGLDHLLHSCAADPADWVLVHDAARPCVQTDDISQLIGRCLQEQQGGLLVSPVVDTVKRVKSDSGMVTTESREGLWRALTPQLFPISQLRSALIAAASESWSVTDESEAMERTGYRPILVEGAASNIKITRAQDLDIAAAILGL